jgi:TatD DNase family protein
VEKSLLFFSTSPEEYDSLEVTSQTIIVIIQFMVDFFDTHCHLNFQVFDENWQQVIAEAKQEGVSSFLIPGTDLNTSKKAISIAKEEENAWAAVGIHPHHVFSLLHEGEKSNSDDVIMQLNHLIAAIEDFLKQEKVVAVGEAGLDRHYYQKTKYQNYRISEQFISLQKDVFIKQAELAIDHRKTLVIHNREAKNDLLLILTDYQSSLAKIPVVFHCCEADLDLLKFAKKNHFFIGIDGDVCYSNKKQDFIKEVPLELLVLETDAPFLSPERKFPNHPKNLKIIAQKVAQIKGVNEEKLRRKVGENSKRLIVKS